MSLPRSHSAYSLSVTRVTSSLVNGTTDQYLWRELSLLIPFDDPRKTSQGFQDIQFNWRIELQRRVRAEIIAHGARSTTEDLCAALAALLSPVQSASPFVLGYEHVPSSSLMWVMDALKSTDMLRRPTLSTLARLRSYSALTVDQFDDVQEKSHMNSMRTRSRCHECSLSNYTKDNDWGPFVPYTGEVDWIRVESIMNGINFNLADHPRHFLDAKPPCGLQPTRAYSAPHATTLAPHDWARVEGIWRRIISPMDYRSIYLFSTRAHIQSGSFFENPLFPEEIISLDTVPEYYALDRLPKGAKYPMLYFSGSSLGIHGSETTVVGSVYMADDDVVRCQFVSAREACMQWSSEGVQIGGITSATEVVGTWTGAYHERGDPAGRVQVALDSESRWLTDAP